MVTLLSPEHMIETPAGIDSERAICRLGVNDVADAAIGEMPPGEKHVAELARLRPRLGCRRPILVHCWAGISRSMAAAYTLLCDRLGPATETRDRASACALARRTPFPIR